jgi:hypothetical protein
MLQHKSQQFSTRISCRTDDSDFHDLCPLQNEILSKEGHDSDCLDFSFARPILHSNAAMEKKMGELSRDKKKEGLSTFL